MPMLKKYKHSLIPVLFIITLIGLSGCMPKKTIVEDDSNESTMPELIALRQKVDRLEKENKNLSAEVTILKERNDGLFERSDKLAKRCNDLQLEVDRRTEQVKLFQDLPAERNKFKAEMEKQKARAEQLERELKELKEKQATGTGQ